jgi:hypothetical protein
MKYLAYGSICAVTIDYPPIPTSLRFLLSLFRISLTLLVLAILGFSFPYSQLLHDYVILISATRELCHAGVSAIEVGILISR